MEEIEYDELRGNVREFKNLFSINRNVNRAQNVDLDLWLYIIPQFQTEILIKFFQIKNIIMNCVNWPEYEKSYNLVNQSSAQDNKLWWCRSKHDIKISLRKNSIIENTQISLQILYFLFFYCFTERKSIE